MTTLKITVLFLCPTTATKLQSLHKCYSPKTLPSSRSTADPFCCVHGLADVAEQGNDPAPHIHTYIYIYVYMYVYFYICQPLLRSTFDPFPKTRMIKLTAHFKWAWVCKFYRQILPAYTRAFAYGSRFALDARIAFLHPKSDSCSVENPKSDFVQVYVQQRKSLESNRGSRQREDRDKC